MNPKLTEAGREVLRNEGNAKWTHEVRAEVLKCSESRVARLDEGLFQRLRLLGLLLAARLRFSLGAVPLLRAEVSRK